MINMKNKTIMWILGALGLTGLFFLLKKLKILPELVNWWKFDENKGIETYDSIGSVNGIISNANWVDGIKRSALEFNGIDSNVNFGNKINFGTGDFSIFVWIKTSTTGVYQMIINKEGIGPRWYFRIHRNNALSVVIDDGVNQILDVGEDGGFSLCDGEWHHVGFVADRDGFMQCYADSVPFGSAKDISSVGNLDNYNDLLVGMRYDGSYDFNGAMDELMIFNKALNEQEIKNIISS